MCKLKLHKFDGPPQLWREKYPSQNIMRHNFEKMQDHVRGNPKNQASWHLTWDFDYLS